MSVFLNYQGLPSCFDYISRKVRQKNKKQKNNNKKKTRLSSPWFVFLTNCLTRRRSVFFNDLAISLTEWPDDRKKTAWVLAQTVSVYFFVKEQRKRKKTAINTKKEIFKMDSKNMAVKSTLTYIFEAIIEKHNFFKF